MLQQTCSQTVGPFFSIGMTYGELNHMVSEETKGERIVICGYVYDGNGVGVDDATVEIWQADAEGIYPHPEDARYKDADPTFSGFGRAATADDGRYLFRTIKPGMVDGMAPHCNVRIFMRGLLLHVVTRLYFSDEDNAADEILNRVPEDRRGTMVAVRDDRPGMPVYRLDFHMQGERETVFFSP